MVKRWCGEKGAINLLQSLLFMELAQDQKPGETLSLMVERLRLGGNR